MDTDTVKKPSNVETEEGEVSDSDQENEDDGFGWKVPDSLVPVKRKKSLKSKSGSSDSEKKVKKDHKESIEKDHKESIKKDHKESIEKDHKESIKKDHKESTKDVDKAEENKKRSWMTLTPGSSSSDSDSDCVDTSSSWYGVFRGSGEDDHKERRDSDKRERKRSKGPARRESEKNESSSWYNLPEEVIGSFGLREIGSFDLKGIGSFGLRRIGSFGLKGIGRQTRERPDSPPSPTRRISAHKRSQTRSTKRSQTRSTTRPLPRSTTQPRTNDFYDINRHSKHGSVSRSRSSKSRSTKSRSPKSRSPKSRNPKNRPDRGLIDLDRMDPIRKSKKQPDGFWSKVPEDESKSRSRTRSPVPIRRSYGQNDRLNESNDRRRRSRSPSPGHKSRSPGHKSRPPGHKSKSPRHKSRSPIRVCVDRCYQKDEVRDQRRIRSLHDYSSPKHRTRRRNASPSARVPSPRRTEASPSAHASSPRRTEVSESPVETFKSKGRSRRSVPHERGICTEEESKKAEMVSTARENLMKIARENMMKIARENMMKMVHPGTLSTGADRSKLHHSRESREGRGIQEWTEFCHAISAMEAAAYSDSSLSRSDIDSDDDIKSVMSEATSKSHPSVTSDTTSKSHPSVASDTTSKSHPSVASDTISKSHPFLVKPKPEIVLKVRNFVALKTRDSSEVQKDLRESFPVSSGDRHRAIEWKQTSKDMGPPAAPGHGALGHGAPGHGAVKKKASVSKEQPDDSVTFLRARMEAERMLGPEDVMGRVPVGAPILVSPAGPAGSAEQVLPEPKIDIGTVMSQRLSAMRVLQNDPENMVAFRQMQDAQGMMDAWSKQCIKPGQWLGQTGAKVLTTEKLHSDPQAKVNGVKTGAIEGGIGKYLLKRMGWSEGKGLGKYENGPLEPVSPVLKFDTFGLRSEDEVVKKLKVRLVSASKAPSRGGINPKSPAPSGKTIEIPVQTELPICKLANYCLQKRFSPPEYEMAEESGPPHKPNFTMKVKVNNIWYQPTISVRTKRAAKHLAASVCLQAFGLLPRDP